MSLRRWSDEWPNETEHSWKSQFVLEKSRRNQESWNEWKCRGKEEASSWHDGWREEFQRRRRWRSWWSGSKTDDAKIRRFAPLLLRGICSPSMTFRIDRHESERLVQWRRRSGSSERSSERSCHLTRKISTAFPRYAPPSTSDRKPLLLFSSRKTQTLGWNSSLRCKSRRRWSGSHGLSVLSSLPARANRTWPKQSPLNVTARLSLLVPRISSRNGSVKVRREWSACLKWRANDSRALSLSMKSMLCAGNAMTQNPSPLDEWRQSFSFKCKVKQSR